MPSVANNDKVWGEGGRDYYLKSGVQSKNNPMITNNAYDGYQGRKVEERITEAPKEKQPKYKLYMLKRITDKCISRGERGLFGLKRLFQTFDTDSSGTLEFKEFKRAIIDFKLDLED